MDPAFSLKTFSSSYVLRAPDFSQCLICEKINNDDPLNNLTKRGLGNFIAALHRRKDSVFDRLHLLIEDEDAFLSKKPLLHRTCRSTYTYRYEVRTSHEGTDDENASTSTSKKRKSIDFKDVCFICEKQRDKKKNYKLILVASVERQRSFYEQALRLEDQDMLLKIQGLGNECIDMIAADFRYHASCMDNYRNKRPLALSPLSIAYDDAFQVLIQEVGSQIVNGGSVFYMTQLTKRYREILNSYGVMSESYPMCNLQRRIANHFGHDINIVPQKGMSSIICSSKIPLGD